MTAFKTTVLTAGIAFITTVGIYKIRELHLEKKLKKMEVEKARLEAEKVKLEKDIQSVSQVFECPDAKYQSRVDKKFLEKLEKRV